MSIALFVTRSIDSNFERTGEEIALDEWLELVKGDPELRLRASPHVAKSPTGQVIEIAARPAETELLVDGRWTPFLHYSRCELSMKLVDDMDDEDDPHRMKIAQIARRFGALITHDAGNQILDW